MCYSFKRMVDDYMKKLKFNDDKKNFTTSEMILLVAIALLIGLSIGVLLNKTSNITKKENVNDEYLQEFIDNYEYILNNYYDDIDKSSLISSAISGMMESLDDPYSMYFDETETNNFSITLDGSYKGIGVQILKDEETGYMLVTTVFKNSPAEEAGLKAGDKIISIDNTEATNLTASEFSTLIKESENDSITLKILRDNSTIDVTVNKSVVTLDSVTSQIYEVENKKIGYIYIGIFANNTYSQFKDALDKLESDNIDSLIIDVRGNTGGHLTAVDQILDLFLSTKQIMYQFEQNGEITSIYGTGKDNKEYPIVLLGNETSASASEVLIAGLTENIDAIFIGKKTYGKGTVQELVTLSDGTQYKITIKKWLTPLGNWINETNGINPDIEVDLDEKYFETYEDEDDTQLQKAIEYLKK